MAFVIDRDKGVEIIPRYTECEKVPYDHKIKRYLQGMEQKGFNRPGSGPAAVCVKLKGMLRYVWRTDVLTEEEYEDHKKHERASVVGVLSPQSRRSVGKVC
jgi:hypothetical protein